MENDKSVTMLDMEEELLEDASGTRKGAIEEELRRLLADVKRHMDSGLPPGEFSMYNAFKEAVEAGLSTVDRAWRGMHGSR